MDNNNSSPVRVLFGIICFAVVLGFFVNSQSMSFGEWSTILMVIGGCVTLCIIGCDSKTISAGLGVFSGKVNTGNVQYARNFWQQVGTYAAMCGYIGAVVGIMSLMGQVRNWEAFFNGTGAALMCAFYGLILRAICTAVSCYTGNVAANTAARGSQGTTVNVSHDSSVKNQDVSLVS